MNITIAIIVATLWVVLWGFYSPYKRDPFMHFGICALVGGLIGFVATLI